MGDNSMNKRLLKKIDGYNIYSVPDDYGRTHLVAYLNRRKVADEMYICKEPGELEKAYQHLIGTIKQKQIKQYGKLYHITAKSICDNQQKVEQCIYEDICKCLMENGVLLIESEHIPPVPDMPVTIGWKINAVPSFGKVLQD